MAVTDSLPLLSSNVHPRLSPPRPPPRAPRHHAGLQQDDGDGGDVDWVFSPPVDVPIGAPPFEDDDSLLLPPADVELYPPYDMVTMAYPPPPGPSPPPYYTNPAYPGRYPSPSQYGGPYYPPAYAPTPSVYGGGYGGYGGYSYGYSTPRRGKLGPREGCAAELVG